MRFDALLLDVGGVFVIPDRELIGEALSSVSVSVQNLDTDRAHYLGMAAVDRNSADGDLYLEGHLAALGVNRDDRPRALAAIVGFSRQPSVALWQQVIAESVEALRDDG
jgi:hypothetical protein